jgi:hypothetical protein
VSEEREWDDAVDGVWQRSFEEQYVPGTDQRVLVPWPDEVERDRQQRVLVWRRSLAERGLVEDAENDHNAECSECKYEFAIPYRDESEGGIDSECIQCPDRRNDLCMRCCSNHSPAECPHWEPDDEEPDFDVDAALEAQLESYLEAAERHYTRIEQGHSVDET